MIQGDRRSWLQSIRSELKRRELGVLNTKVKERERIEGEMFQMRW